MDILLIGGSGIISSEICTLAIKKGDRVSIFNRGRRKEEINPSAKLIIGDIRNDSTQDILDKLDEYYDVVIDFISYTPSQLEKTVSIVEKRCKQFIFISSATAYSIDNKLPLTEDSKIGNKSWKYAQDKADCEQYLSKCKMECQWTIIRPYITYGHTRIPFQVAPLEYYTIINRIKHHKPIMICGENVQCTLTNSKDFAIGAYGLLLNENAYGESFHITGDNRITWKEVAICLAKKIGEDIEIIDIPIEYIKSRKKECGFDVAELIGDKSRDMIFDNSKIKKCVTDFRKFKNFEDAIDDTLKYFEVQSHRNINYKWDAEIDRFIEKYAKSVGLKIDYKKLNVEGYDNDITDIQKKEYIEHRTVMNKVIGKIIRKICGGKRP